MTDRTDFTTKPRTPAEKMREIENRLGLHAKGLIKWALRVQRLERDFAEHIHHTVSQDHVSGPVLPDGVIGPGDHPLRHQSDPSGIDDGPGLNLAPPAEPPGSPTVEEAEDRPIDLTPEQQKRITDQWQQAREAVEEAEDVRHHCVTCEHNLDNQCAKGYGILVGLHEEDGAMCGDWSRKEDGHGKLCSRCALWQPIPDSLHQEGTCGKYGRPSIEVTKADDTCGAWRMAEPYQPRRSCWEFRDADGCVVSWMQEYAGENSTGPSGARSKHRMVELRDGDGIYPQALIDSYEEMRDERYSLKASVTDLRRRAAEREDHVRELKTECDRVKELESLIEPYEALVSENDALRALGDHKEKAIEHLCAKLKETQAAEHELKRENERLSSRVKELVSLVKALQRVAEAQCLAVNAEIQKRVAAETADREYREKIADWLAEMTND